jgi:hypothetical protein
MTIFNTSSEESSTIAVRFACATIGSGQTPALQRLSNGSRLFRLAGDQSSLSGGAMMATPRLPQSAEVGDPPAPKDGRVQLTIDSLRNYELLRPIPVVVESVAGTFFTAQAQELNLSISETSLEDALVILQDQITTIYEEYRMKKTLNPEQARRLEILQMYIGKTRRNRL